MTTLHHGSKTWNPLNSKRVVSEIVAKRGSSQIAKAQCQLQAEL